MEVPNYYLVAKTENLGMLTDSMKFKRTLTLNIVVKCKF